MKRSDLTILLSVIGVLALAAFWLLVLSPKRDQSAKLADEVDQLRSSVQQQQQLASLARQARADFDTDYRRLVVLGKAVPADADTPSLLLEVQRLANESGVGFQSIELSETGSSGEASQVATPPPLVAPGSTESSTNTGSEESSTTPASGTSPATDGTSGTSTTSAPTPATEASAALLPLGATVGPAGLAVMPYSMRFNGGFFQIADFLRRLGQLTRASDQGVAVDGRLLTVDGFTLAADPGQGFPHLVADLAVTTYVTPESQGLTGGATASGPATSVAAATTPEAAASTGAPASAPAPPTATSTTASTP